MYFSYKNHKATKGKDLESLCFRSFLKYYYLMTVPDNLVVPAL